jgi:two-component system OmpR family response regulator
MKKILIVDDDSDLLFGLNALLTNKGYEIRTLDEGGTAIPVIQEFHPDIILLDVNLPGMDARKICKLIKHNSPPMHTPVIMISANADRKDVTEVWEADDFMGKPFSLRSLYSKIETLIA